MGRGDASPAVSQQKTGLQQGVFWARLWNSCRVGGSGVLAAVPSPSRKAEMVSDTHLNLPSPGPTAGGH